MEPTNKKERSNFILKFTLAFIFGIVIILVPFYFLLRLPGYEHNIMAKDYNDMQTQMRYQKEHFAIQIDSVKTIIDKYELPNQDIDKLNADLGMLLSAMEQPFISDTTWSGRMYKNIVKSYIDLKKAKNDLIQSVKILQDCKKDLDKAKEEAKKNMDTMGG